LQRDIDLKRETKHRRSGFSRDINEENTHMSILVNKDSKIICQGIARAPFIPSSASSTAPRSSAA